VHDGGRVLPWEMFGGAAASVSLSLSLSLSMPISVPMSTSTMVTMMMFQVKSMLVPVGDYCRSVVGRDV
jgi:hypothetical protein